ncbi:hypothetical protein ACIRPH_13305 [Nocardiopsis sp. NPDC101807]|uniref:hypothetical protein n=1 Tax=Nocardiopsis sp. NPDC101807 TaxID=3364339 RepID=UPI0037F88C73
MKFDHVSPEHDGRTPAPGARFPEGHEDPAAEPSAPLHVLGLRRTSEYMRLRARTDLERTRPALNRLLHTVEAAHQAEAAPPPGDAADAEVFRPESFRARPPGPTDPPRDP